MGTAARHALATYPVWEIDGRDWPNREASRFVFAGGLRWHLQALGEGPLLLLAHGTGAATHSWRGLLPALARHYRVVAPDLPGHGFTEAPSPRRLSLQGMAQALQQLLDEQGLVPEIVVGHSAGAAVLLRMALDGRIAPRLIVGLNGALLPFTGLPGELFSPIAKLLARTSVVPRMFSWQARDPANVARLLRGTGSTLEPAGLELYGRLARRPGHVASALAMMAHWDLAPLARDLPKLKAPLTLVVGGNDRSIPPTEARRVRALLPATRIVSLAGLGHLAHEEQPARIAELIMAEAAAVRAPA